MNTEKSRISTKEAIDFVGEFNEIYFQTFSYHLSTFVSDGFLKDLFEKNPTVAKDKAQLLIEKFGESANPQNFTQQAAATNIQPTTLSLIFSIALQSASRSWDNFATQFLTKFSEEEYGDSDDMLDDSSDDGTPVDHEKDYQDLLRKGYAIPPDPVIDTPASVSFLNSGSLRNLKTVQETFKIFNFLKSLRKL